MTIDRRQAIDAILEKYQSDAAFKERLLSDPQGALAESGLFREVSTEEDDECGGTGTCSHSCGGTCDNTCGMLSCRISI